MLEHIRDIPNRTFWRVYKPEPDGGGSTARAQERACEATNGTFDPFVALVPTAGEEDAEYVCSGVAGDSLDMHAPAIELACGASVTNAEHGVTCVELKIPYKEGEDPNHIEALPSLHLLFKALRICELLTRSEPCTAVNAGEMVMEIHARFSAPARLTERTPGQSQLFIDHAISWPKYAQLLDAMRNTRVISLEFYEFCIKRKASFVRIR